MKQFTVTRITKEIALRGTLNGVKPLKQGTYVFAAKDRILGETEVSEAHMLPATGNRVLMIRGLNNDEDLDSALSELGEGVILCIYPVENPENRSFMKVTNIASVVKLFGTMVGNLSPDRDLDGRLHISGEAAMTVHCYEPKTWRGTPTLQIDAKSKAVRLINEAIQGGREVLIHLAVFPKTPDP